MPNKLYINSSIKKYYQKKQEEKPILQKDTVNEALEKLKISVK